MLLVSCGALLVTAGMAFQDYQRRKKEELKKEENKEKKKIYQSIKLLLTGGPYIYLNIAVEGKVKESIVYIITSNR